MAQHADRLVDPGEGKASRREIADGVLLADARYVDDVVQDRGVERQVAHGLVEIDQAAGRIETYRRLAVVVLELRIEGTCEHGQERRLAGAVDAQQGNPVTSGDRQPID